MVSARGFKGSAGVFLTPTGFFGEFIVGDIGWEGEESFFWEGFVWIDSFLEERTGFFELESGCGLSAMVFSGSAGFFVGIMG